MVPRFAAENRKANQAFVDWLNSVRGTEAGDAGAGRARMAARAEAMDCPIPGTTKPHRLEENLGAAQVQLTVDDLREIDRPGRVRY